MTWFKVDDTLAFHRKTVAAGVSALGLWVRAGSWCAQTLTDGFVPEHMVPALADGDAGLAGRLVEAGLWRRVKGGYAFHEWADYQPSRQSIENRRAVRAAAGRNGGVRSGQVRRGLRSKTEASASQLLEPPTRPDPTRPQGGHVENLANVDQRARTRVEPQPLPDDWVPHDAHAVLARKHGLDLDHEAEQFRAHALDKGRVSANWHEAFRYWLGNASTRPTRRLRAVNDGPATCGDFWQD